MSILYGLAKRILRDIVQISNQKICSDIFQNAVNKQIV